MFRSCSFISSQKWWGMMGKQDQEWKALNKIIIQTTFASNTGSRVTSDEATKTRQCLQSGPYFQMERYSSPQTGKAIALWFKFWV
jgi:hypothetical protein